jgi:hypothetical protein
MTEITLEVDYDLYSGPTKMSSTVTEGGRFRLHILPNDIRTLLVVSRDFAGTTVERDAVYSVEEALKMGFLAKIELAVDKITGQGAFTKYSSKVKAYEGKKKKKPVDKSGQ